MSSHATTIGGWRPDGGPPAFTPHDVAAVAAKPREQAFVVRDAHGAIGVGVGGSMAAAPSHDAPWPVLGVLPPLYPEWLGDRRFTARHGVRFPYVVGAMANGITTARMVREAHAAGVLSFFGAAGLRPERVEAEVSGLRQALGTEAGWGSNLIHSPAEPALEHRIVDIYLRHGVRRASASAYLALTPAVVRYAFAGARRGPDGAPVRAQRVLAKVSRPETAQRFLAPAPAALLDSLRADGLLTAEELELAAQHPVATDIIAEADSGGHTDNRPLTALLPVLFGVRDAAMSAHRAEPILIGAAGGIGTPQAAAAAYAAGAAFVLTGSVNQACVESGLSEAGRVMLAQADMADVIMAPAADMFEMGVEVQVLRRGTMFAQRGARLYRAWRTYDGLDAIPPDERRALESGVLGATFDEVWAKTRAYFEQVEPGEIDRAERDPKHRMALVFRWYLGLSSRWAIDGVAERRADYQIWCGPAMGAFNRWVAGTFLEPHTERSVAQVARNLLEGAAAVTRAAQLRSYGVSVPEAAFTFVPRPLA